MPTSGSIDFSTTTNEICTEALELLGVLQEGQYPNAEQLAAARRTLNMMVKNWQAEGLNLFAVDRTYLFPKNGLEVYDLCIPASTSTTRYVTNFYELTTSAAGSATDTTLSVVDNTALDSFEDDDVVGVHLDDKTIHWTTATLSGTTLTLNDALPSAAASGNGIYGYTFSTDAANRPMKILEVYNEQYTGTGTSHATPVDQLARVDYYTLNDKLAEGYVNQCYYDPQIGCGKFYVWPTPQDEKDYLLILVQRTLNDFDASSNEPDYPQEWYMPLAYNLAKHLAPKYGTPQMDYVRVVQQAMELYERARDFDSEMYTSTYFQPENRWQ